MTGDGTKYVSVKQMPDKTPDTIFQMEPRTFGRHTLDTY